MKFFRKWMALVIVALMLCVPTTAAFAAEEKTDSASYAYTQVSEVVYATGSVNIRTGPGTDNPIIGVLRKGKSIRRIAVGSNGWSKVMYEGELAYIHSSYLSTSRPDGDPSDLDTQELTRQIAIANGLNQMDYTAESWANVTSALDEACAILGGNDQSAVDASAQTLKNAMTALVRMDYTALEAALADMQALGEDDSANALWLELMQAAQKGKGLLTSGDQAAVDAAAAEITALLTQIKETIDTKPAPEVVIQEVPVEVYPKDSYCNIPTHRVWQVLFFASAALNVVLAVVIVVYTTKKKRKQRDNTPLVDYDIFDDTM